MSRFLIAVYLLSFAVACIGCNVRVGPPGAPGGPGGAPEGAPMAVSATQLAQDFQDGGSGRYAGKTLEVSGVVSRLERPQAFEKEPGPEDLTDSVVFLIPVKDKQGAQKEYRIRCLLKPQLTPAQRQAACLAKGKEVTLRGQILAIDLNNPQASLQNCTLVGAAR